MAVGKTCTNRGNWLTGKQQRRWDATCCQAHSVSEGGKKCFSWFTLKSDYIFICSYNQCKILRWWSIEMWDLHFINAKVYGGNKVGSEVINEGWISGVQKFCFLKQKDVSENITEFLVSACPRWPWFKHSLLSSVLTYLSPFQEEMPKGTWNIKTGNSMLHPSERKPTMHFCPTQKCWFLPAEDAAILILVKS